MHRGVTRRLLRAENVQGSFFPCLCDQGFQERQSVCCSGSEPVCVPITWRASPTLPLPLSHRETALVLAAFPNTQALSCGTQITAPTALSRCFCFVVYTVVIGFLSLVHQTQTLGSSGGIVGSPLCWVRKHTEVEHEKLVIDWPGHGSCPVSTHPFCFLKHFIWISVCFSSSEQLIKYLSHSVFWRGFTLARLKVFCK